MYLSQQELQSVLNVQLSTETYAELCVSIIAKQVAQIKERRDNCGCGDTNSIPHSNLCTFCHEVWEVECNSIKTIKEEDFFKLSEEHQERLINICHINIIDPQGNNEQELTP